MAFAAALFSLAMSGAMGLAQAADDPKAIGTYQSPEAFVAESFSGQPPKAKTLWMRGELKKAAAKIMAHRYSKLRVKYWRQGDRTAWVLEETGKDQPITVGYVVQAGRIERVKVLIYRESRGWEVRYPFFLEQFDQARLEPEHTLDRHIDGISGATLSVRALTKLARLALMLHGHVTRADG